MEMDLQSSIIPLIVEMLVATFKSAGAVNYWSIELNHDELGPLELLIQRRWGDTPAKKAARAEEKIEDLKDALHRIVLHDPKIPGLKFSSYESLLESAIYCARTALESLAQSQTEEERSDDDETAPQKPPA